jgi:hypothetical protein
MALDHGMLNLPLAKRGNIDAQLDAYKAGQARDAAAKRKAATALSREQKAAAKVALAEIQAAPGLMQQKAFAMRVTPRVLAAQLDDWSKWQPATLLKLHAKWLPKVAP